MFDPKRKQKNKPFQFLQPFELLESRQLLSSVAPDAVLSADRFGFGGFGGFGGHGGGYGGGGFGGGGFGGGHNGGSGGTSINYYVPPSGYSPSQIATAYGLTSATSSSGAQLTGAGTTIAIVDAYNDPNIISDLKTFDKEFNIAAPPSFSVVSQTGAAGSTLQTDAGWAQEISLDVEWAHADAPGANIVLVEAKNSNTNNLLAAVNYARNLPGVDAVSMSWGGSEFANEASDDGYFTTPTGHTNIAFFAASGDDGAYGAEWPASSPNVISVGGTTLYSINSTGEYGTESSWSDGGGGASVYESEPTYQDAVGKTNGRDTPDVSFDANPETGYQVYDSLSYEGEAGWQEIGGTSAGTPQWAAIISLADQSLIQQGKSTLSSNQALDLFYSSYSTTNYSSFFHDITSGAATGYDKETGLGTPIVNSLVSALDGSSASAPAIAKAAAKTSSKVTNAVKPRTPERQFAPDPTAPDAPPPTAVSLSPTPESGPQQAPAPVGQAPAPIQSAIPVVAFAPPKSSGSLIVTGVTQVDGSVFLQPATVTSTGSPFSQHSLVWTTATIIGATRTELADIIETELPAFKHVLFSSAPIASMYTSAEIGSVRAGTVGISAYLHAPIEVAASAPHVLLQLAQIDAGVFVNSMRAFATESATIATAAVNGGHGMSRPFAMAAASVLADVILIGYWQYNRKKKAKEAAEQAAQGVPA